MQPMAEMMASDSRGCWRSTYQAAAAAPRSHNGSLKIFARTCLACWMPSKGQLRLAGKSKALSRCSPPSCHACLASEPFFSSLSSFQMLFSSLLSRLAPSMIKHDLAHPPGHVREGRDNDSPSVARACFLVMSLVGGIVLCAACRCLVASLREPLVLQKAVLLSLN